MTDRLIRVFVNSTPVDVPSGSSALDAVRTRDPAAAAGVADGARVVTDSRGLPIDPATPMQAGAILRVIPARQRAGAAAEDPES